MKKNKIYYKNEQSTKDDKTLKICEVRNKTIIIGNINDTIASNEYENIVVVPFKKDITIAINKNEKIMFNIPKIYGDIKHIITLNDYEFSDDINEVLTDIKYMYKLEMGNKSDYFEMCDELLLSNCLKVLKELSMPITLDNLKKLMFNTNGDGIRILMNFSRITTTQEIYEWFVDFYYSSINGAKGTPKTFEHTCGIRNFINSLLDNGFKLESYISLFFKNLEIVLSELNDDATIVIENLDTYEAISNICYGNLFKTTYYLNNKNINYICFVKNLLFLNNLDENLKELILEEHELIDLKPSDLYSGEIKLRVPKILHQELAKKASMENTSLNQYLLYLISKNI